jgi:hypothetical protein
LSGANVKKETVCEKGRKQEREIPLVALVEWRECKEGDSVRKVESKKRNTISCVVLKWFEKGYPFVL